MFFEYIISFPYMVTTPPRPNKIRGWSRSVPYNRLASPTVRPSVRGQLAKKTRIFELVEKFW